MSQAQLNVEPQSLSIKQTFDAPIDRLFACFTQPDLLNQWHAPGNMTTEADVDLRVGGGYRIAMTNDEGNTHTAIGEYQEIDAPNKLVYTWAWEGAEGPPTTVTVLFTAVGKQTQVELIHVNFPNEEAAQHHSQGWSGIYANLSAYLTD